ncbi:uncharacterized protein YeaO (DUF488 family) [Dysgonomonas sp. PFB1-18]|uniref:DUF488 domain-containing protein n=1 Tax=unclassified Dysgonomonas TaxID=2630389 RepID=UPI00247368FF|nr:MULTISPECIES: DUF488 family protein [unclassified Dysgonomonas]MDL2303307.1 DUF488 family protein [Dysgonomonas sp. OttesenSCG-928-D17]MDH6309670.1 uncharacterized protein YeaO (DUF488 family) [Dysgonomonas sp. PF1-14]MDH6339322.1 uncharacterized protein YeaO (DUF488 family) [Dysgonomonas sp. PF1-16]MDH6380821.1 uncharacterized protein YeaO (DUF488 family) [Dysgonomonas sp. PFB1-18]MDH6398317.1 uncharacterized protein YeaO (DUF488 family) [Dysgonomonas sp. PF1-23]
MVQIKLKRVYEDMSDSDGFRVLVDQLWPRGMKKEYLHYDLWAKDITPSSDLRKWFHDDPADRWDSFAAMYTKELNQSEAVKKFIETIRPQDTVTLLYASKEPEHNHAKVLKAYLDKMLESV